MKKILNLIIFAAIVSLSFSVWAAEKMKEPKVEYSADMVTVSDQISMNSKINYALGGKQRMETTYNGQTSIMIIRQDKKVGWMLMPQQNMYMEMSFDESKSKSGVYVNDCETNNSVVGSESVNGISATKSKMSMSCPNDTALEGNMWVTKDDIMVKMDAVSTQGSKKVPIKMELKNLKIGSQDASLFEIPSGYQKFSMGDMSSIMKMSQDKAAQGAQKDASKSGTAVQSGSETSKDNADSGQGVEKATDDTKDTLKGAMDKLKGIDIFGK